MGGCTFWLRHRQDCWLFDSQGKQILSIGELPAADAGAKTGRALITFGEDCDGAADGKDLRSRPWREPHTDFRR